MARQGMLAAARPPAVPAERPVIERVTLNGFRVRREPGPIDLANPEHVFHVTQFPEGVESRVVVAIDEEALARVARLSRRALQPGGAFWRYQAERLLSGVL